MLTKHKSRCGACQATTIIVPLRRAFQEDAHTQVDATSGWTYISLNTLTPHWKLAMGVIG